MAILNYTTKVPAMKTAAEIAHILGKKGALSVQQRYVAGRVCGISFTLIVSSCEVSFELPVNVEGVLKHMKSVKSNSPNRDQAERVAWRIVKDWIQVQIALVESNQAEIGQVFMPYALLDNGRTTAYAQFSLAASTQKQLGSGK